MKTHVVKIGQDATLEEAVDLMDIYQVNALPVVDTEGVLCGMLTVSDVVRAMQSVAVTQPVTQPRGSSESILDNAAPHVTLKANRLDPSMHDPSTHDTPMRAVRLWTVRDCMTAEVQSVEEHEEITHAARLLLVEGRKRLPVVDYRRRVVGMLDRVDVLQAVFEQRL